MSNQCTSSIKVEKKKSRTGLRKTLSEKEKKFLVVLSTTWALFHILVASQGLNFLASNIPILYDIIPQPVFSFLMMPAKIRIVHITFALISVFFVTPIARHEFFKTNRLYDYILMGIAVITLLITLYRYDILIKMGGRYDQIDIYYGIVGLIILFEASRRVVSPGLSILALLALGYTFFGNSLNNMLSHSGFSINRIIQHLYLSGEGVFGFVLGVSAEIIIVFIIFGAVLLEVGVADYFYDLSNAIAGKQRGGPAKVAVISSGLMGMVSGETSANVATTGSFTIPLMKRVGYTPAFSGAVECASSAGGQILPPVMGATAFLIADSLGIPYIQLALAALLPALLYYVSVFSTVHFRAVNLNLEANSDNVISKKELFSKIYLLLPLVGIVVLLTKDYTPTFSAFWGGIIPAIVLSYFKSETKLNSKKFINIFMNATRTAMSLAVACAVVGIIVGTASLTGITMTIASLIFSAAKGIKIVVLIMTMVVSIILGMGLPTSAAYVLTSISAAPALILLEIEYLPAHLFVLYFGVMSALTPPVATGAYTAAGLSGANPNKVGFTSLKIAISGFIVPFLFIYSPELLIYGDQIVYSKTIFTFISVFMGLVMLSSSLEGAMFNKLTIFKRIAVFMLAILLIWPIIKLKIIGIVLSFFIVTYEYMCSKKSYQVNTTN